MSMYFAIDPGAKGSIAYCIERTVNGQEWAHVGLLPLTDPPCLDDFSTLSPSHYTAVIEDIPMGGWGPIPQSTVAKLHQGYGKILGILEVRGFRVIRVKPQEWQKSCGAGTKKYHGKDWKKHLAQIARERFPHTDFKVDQADSLLILDHAIRNRL